MVSSAASDAPTGFAAGTHDQIIHTDLNVSSHDCNFCHLQVGVASGPPEQGKEWADASFHAKFTSSSPLTINGTTGRCSNCHMNVKPGASFTGQDHSSYTNVSGSTDCSSCHSWPGTGTVSAPNWLGAAGGVPQYIPVGGFNIPQPPATAGTAPEPNISNLPHPTVGSTPCTTCHSSASGGVMAKGYDHASTLANSRCDACHEAGTNLIGTLWSGATSEPGAGDSRPYTLASISACQGCIGGPGNGTTERAANHFYPADCHECHNAPTGISTVTTGSAYIGNGTPTSTTCQLTSNTCQSTGVACSATAPCPTGQSCRGTTCQVDCPSGQSCNNGTCQVQCPNSNPKLFCVNYVCNRPSAWWFPHTQSKMTNPSTCVMCHTNGVPN
jgi:hypothetical protein